MATQVETVDVIEGAFVYRGEELFVGEFGCPDNPDYSFTDEDGDEWNGFRQVFGDEARLAIRYPVWDEFMRKFDYTGAQVGVAGPQDCPHCAEGKCKYHKGA